MSIRPINSLLRVASAGLLVGLVLAGCGPSEPETKGAPVGMRRLTEAQYSNIITDIFGAGITNIAVRFDSIPRTDGLLAVGASTVSVTPSGFVRYDNLARSIAAQAVNEDNRNVLVSCKPADPAAADDACARKFYSEIGRLLYRRPIGDEEVNDKVKLARDTATSAGDFYAGLANGLAVMLTAPQFLYVADYTEPDPDRPGKQRLDAYSKAARLSFLLWDTTPDDDLLAAAERGDLDTEKGLTKVVDGMLASPRLEAGVRAFMADMLALDAFDRLEKDGTIYPAFTSAVAADAKEQTLRTAVDLLVTQRADYREIFTTRKTFMSGPLAALLNVPTSDPTKWVRYEFPEGDPRVGIQAQPGFLALHAHAGTSSPTLRGRAIRELMFCQKVPDPPADVSFEAFNDPNAAEKTRRQRLDAHSTNPTCAGCHKIMDPLGLTLENFDGAGQFRTTDGGVPIDAAGDVDGQPFVGPAELGKKLAENPAATSCLVNRLYAYATGRTPANSERALMTYFHEQFANDGYRVPDLLRHITTSDAFFAVVPGATTAADAAAASKKENNL